MKKTKFIIALSIVFTLLLAVLQDGSQYIAPILPSINPGSTGSEVMEMQQRLKNWGYYAGNVNGQYGIETFYAVMNFQEKYNLLQSGIADTDTLFAMGLTRLAKTGTALAQGSGTSEEQLLARAINGEARGEPYEGQVAVGAVILNRVNHSSFPKTVAGVIYQPGAFTAVSDGQINVPIDPNSEIVKAARDAMNGWDPTGGCIYYWNPATATSQWIWSRQIVKKIGKHNFAK